MSKNSYTEDVNQQQSNLLALESPVVETDSIQWDYQVALAVAT